MIDRSTLAALAVPEERLHQVAARVSQYPEVNHNYAREHRYNLWFVLTGPNRQHIERVLEELELVGDKDARLAA